MNGRIVHETTPARRVAALAFSVILEKYKEFTRENRGRDVDKIFFEEFIDYADLATPLDVVLQHEFTLIRIDEQKFERDGYRKKALVDLERTTLKAIMDLKL